MTRTQHMTPLLALLLLGLGLVGMLTPLQAEAGDPHIINLRPEGPHPERLTIRGGTAVVWVSHLATTKLVVTTVAFLEGQRAAQATTAVEGYNGFVLEGEHFVGRLEGNGGKVALRFVTPGEYTYTHGHREYLTGTIMVHQ